MVSDVNNCSASATSIVTVAQQNTIVVPNAFSPNNDDVNDIFLLNGYNIARVELEVYNRWGNKVYSSDITNLSNGWDGTYKGIAQELGVYVYYGTVTYTDGKQESLKGNVTLLR